MAKNTLLTGPVNESDSSVDYISSNGEITDVLKINEIQGFKIDFIKNLGYEFHVFGSGSEVLDGEKNLKIDDLDIQMVINEDEDKKAVTKKLQNLGFKITEVSINHIIAKKDGKEYDFHFIKKVKKADGFIEDGFLEGTHFFPESGYKEKNGIKFIKPEMTYIMATNSRRLGNNNVNNDINIEKEMEGIDKKAVILLDFIEYEIIQKRGKLIFKDLTFPEIISKVKEFIQKDYYIAREDVKLVLKEIDILSESELKEFENNCMKYRKIQKQVKRINRLKNNIDHDEVLRLQGLTGFIKS